MEEIIKKTSGLAWIDGLCDSIEQEREKLASAQRQAELSPFKDINSTNWNEVIKTALNDAGEKFGWGWVSANEAAASFAESVNFDYDSKHAKAFLMGLVRAVLDTTKK